MGREHILILFLIGSGSSALAPDRRIHPLLASFLEAFLDLWKSEIHFGGGLCDLVTVGLNPAAEAELAKGLVDGVGFFAPAHLDNNATRDKAVSEVLKSGSWCVLTMVNASSAVDGVNSNLATEDTLRRVEEVTRVVNWRRVLVLTSNLDGARLFHHLTFGTDVSGADGLIRVARNCSHCFDDGEKGPLVRSFWSPQAGFFGSLDDVPECCPGKSELRGKAFDVAAFGTIPYVEFGSSDAGDVVATGIDVDILSILAETLGFIPNVLTDVRGWYYTDSNGTKRGLVGVVHNGDALLACGHISVVYERHLVVTYSLPTYFIRISYMTNLPKRRDPFFNVVSVFDLAVWAATAASVAGSAAAFALVWNAYRRLVDRDALPYPLGRPKTALDFILMPWGMLLMQGAPAWFDAFPKFTAGSFLVLVWTYGGFLTTLAYSSNLLASLIAVDYEKPADTFDEMLASALSGGLFYVPRESSVMLSMRTSPDPAQRELAALADSRDSFWVHQNQFPWELLDHVLESGMGGVMMIDGMFDLESDELMRRYNGVPFRMMKENLFSGPAAFVMPKHCSFADDVNSVIGTLVESGIVDQLFDRRVSARQKATLRQSAKGGDGKNGETRLGLITVASSLMLLGFSLAGSALVFVGEVVLHRKNKRKTEEEAMELKSSSPSSSSATAVSPPQAADDRAARRRQHVVKFVTSTYEKSLKG